MLHTCFYLNYSLLQSKMLVFHFFFRKNGTNKDPLEDCSFLLVSPTMSSNQFNITFFQLTKKLHGMKVCGNSGTQDKESIKFPQSTLWGKHSHCIILSNDNHFYSAYSSVSSKINTVYKNNLTFSNLTRNHIEQNLLIYKVPFPRHIPY